MSQSIRTTLTPLLMISYIFGLRVANLPIVHASLWFSLLYMLIVWVIYYFLLMSAVIPFFNSYISIGYYICYLTELFTTLLSIVFGIYHNAKFRNCLEKLDSVDNTLFELNTVTDNDKLHKKSLWLVLGWFMITILINCSKALFLNIEYDCDIVTGLLFIFILYYTFHINAIGDLTTASIIGYIGLKFDQINELLQNLTENNKYGMKQAYENPIIHSYRCRFLNTLGNKYLVWIVIHIHLELSKISREVDSIFGTQMTFKMACYFNWIVVDLSIIFSTLLIDNYVKSSKIMCVVLYSILFFHNIYKFLLINYLCETVSSKASATKDLLNRLSYSTFDVEIREIISQFSLQMTYAPLKFCGIGLFQFGFKFLHGFIMSIATVLVIVIQTSVNK